MNVLLAGENILGYRIAKALMEDHQVVYLSPEGSDSAHVEELDVEVVRGDVTATETLRRAGAHKAEAFVACTASDEHNIVACLLARGMGAGRTLCVLQRGGYARAGGSDERLAETLGIDSVVRPGQQLADEIFRIVTVPGALDVEVFAGGRVGLMRYAVGPGSTVDGARLKDLRLPRNALVVAIRREDQLTIPRGDTRLREGDKVIAMGRGAGLRGLLPLMSSPAAKGRSRRAAIVGLGSVGLSVARQLEEAGWQVKAVESSRVRCEQVAPALKGLVLHGNGTDLDLLTQEHIGELPVVVTVTNNDETNLLVSLLAKHLGARRIITRADRLADEILFEKVGIDVVRSAHGAAVRSVLREIGGNRQRELRTELEHGDARIIELTLPPHFATTELSRMRPPTHAVVGSILRDGNAIVPTGSDVLQAGDRMLVFCTREDEAPTRDFFMRLSPADGD